MGTTIVLAKSDLARGRRGDRGMGEGSRRSRFSEPRVAVQGTTRSRASRRSTRSFSISRRERSSPRSWRWCTPAGAWAGRPARWSWLACPG